MIWAIFLLLLGACQPRTYSGLQSINVLDQNGLSETITSRDRLEQFEKVDFLTPQPYQKVLRVFWRDKESHVNAFITSYHPNGGPKQYLEVVDGRAFGNYTEWHSNGNIKLSATVIGGTADLNATAEKSWLFDGESAAWDEKGRLEAKIIYSRGVLEGTALYYHPNGKLFRTVPYKKDEIEGVVEVFLDSGERIQSTEYLQGRLQNGLYFDKMGNILSKVENGNGFRIALSERQEIKNGRLEGEMQSLDADGKLLRRYQLEDGLKSGEEIEYYPGGKPKLTLQWHEGMIQGSVKSWYASGQMESEREMSQNLKNGISRAWYLDGTMMLIEEYDRESLLKGSYFKKGDRFPVSEVVNGKGVVTLYDSVGNFLRKVNYTQGKPVE